MVIKIANKIFGSVHNFDDIVSAGYLGLIEAVDNYNKSFCIKFSTFSGIYIRGRMKRYLENDHLIRYPNSLWQDKRAKEKGHHNRLKYKDTTLVDKIENTEILDISDYDYGENPVGQIDAAIDIKKILSILDHKTKIMIEKYYLEGLTLEEIATDFNMTRQAIDGRIKRGFKKIKLSFSDNNLA
jgi:RNA polymerase sporulation-specific sigma factor